MLRILKMNVHGIKRNRHPSVANAQLIGQDA